LFTALAYVDANDLVFVDISMGHCSKAEALRTRTKFELRSLQQLLFIFHGPSQEGCKFLKITVMTIVLKGDFETELRQRSNPQSRLRYSEFEGVGWHLP